jgi:DNA invertase Pin-like site-specific DNA recombinase
VTRAAIYCRISGPNDQATARQAEDCRGLVAERGWDVVGTFTDEGRSAFTGAPRPAYDSLLEAVAAGLVDVVVAWHLDRLHRRPEELEPFLDRLERLGVSVATVVSGDVLVGTPAGRLHARVGVAVAAHELDLRRERVRRAELQAAQLGFGPAGGRSFGYRRLPDKSMEVVPGEGAVIREMAERVIGGETAGAIARDLNRRGAAGRWSAQQMRKLLVRPMLAGWTSVDTKRVAPGRWPALVSEEEHAALVDLLRVRAVTRPTTCLVTGSLIRCGRCGATLGRFRPRPGRVAYACRGAPLGCGRLSIRAPLVDEPLTERLLRRLDDPEAPWPSEPGATDPIVELGDLRARAERLGALASRREVLPMEFVAARQVMHERRKELATQLDVAAPVGGALRSSWPLMSLEGQREVVRRLVQRVVIRPATAEPRVVITWR